MYMQNITANTDAFLMWSRSPVWQYELISSALNSVMHFVTRGQGNLSWRLVSFQWDWSQVSAALIIKLRVNNECACAQICVCRVLSFGILRTELSFCRDLCVSGAVVWYFAYRIVFLLAYYRYKSVCTTTWQGRLIYVYSECFCNVQASPVFIFRV